MLTEYIQKAEKLLEKRFGFKLERSSLILHNDWDLFIKENNLDLYCKSVFFPKDLTAHVHKGNLEEILPLAYHELEGHGLYCEYTLQGKALVEAEKKFARLKGKEKQIFASEWLEYFQSIQPYFEGFAIWIEEFLLKGVGRDDLWVQRKKKLKQTPFNLEHSYFDTYNGLKNFEKKTDVYKLWRSLGFPIRV